MIRNDLASLEATGDYGIPLRNHLKKSPPRDPSDEEIKAKINKINQRVESHRSGSEAGNDDDDEEDWPEEARDSSAVPPPTSPPKVEQQPQPPQSELKASDELMAEATDEPQDPNAKFVKQLAEDVEEACPPKPDETERERSNSDVEMEDITNDVRAGALSGRFDDKGERRKEVDRMKKFINNLSGKFIQEKLQAGSGSPRIMSTIALRSYTIVDTILKLFHSVTSKMGDSWNVNIKELTGALELSCKLPSKLSISIRDEWPNRNALVHDAFHEVDADQVNTALRLANDVGDWAWNLVGN